MTVVLISRRTRRLDLTARAYIKCAHSATLAKFAKLDQDTVGSGNRRR